MGLNVSFLVYSVTGTVDLTGPADVSAAEDVMRRLPQAVPWEDVTLHVFARSDR